jgi:XTP/dITP diphosphohydrolase
VILYCATGNAGKLREFRSAARDPWRIEPMPGLSGIDAPEETGTTFEENAIQKARYYAQFAGESPIFAEDSGIEVDALDGAPGVYSARFAGPGADDSRNNRLLLDRLRDAANRRARYIAVIALILPGNDPRTFRGVAEGEILREPKGPGGFGYDPLFFYPPFAATFAEIPADKKLTVSHRGRAVEKMMDFLKDKNIGPRMNTNEHE